jgi:hypothetical protein
MVTAPYVPPPPVQLSAASASSPVLSHDGRIARYAAFVSGGNVYVVHRAPPWGQDGTPWAAGPTGLVTGGLGGAPSNGLSGSPAFAGNDFRQPRCLAFVSSATNLVAGDSNGHADVFILGLHTGRVRRIPTPADATAVSVDARCSAYAFVAGGTLYVRDRKGRTRRQSGVGGVSDPQMSYNGKDVVFERNGLVMYARVGGGQRQFGPGAHPAADGFGRFLAFERDGGIFVSTLRRGNPVRIDGGVAPAMTSGGHAVLYGQGPLVRLSTKLRPVAACPSGNVVEVSTSPHGNYVEFTCSTGGVYLGYLGPKSGK